MGFSYAVFVAMAFWDSEDFLALRGRFLGYDGFGHRGMEVIGLVLSSSL